MRKYETVIGLEVHAQLKTNSKMFCSCPNNFGDEPNTNICPVCTGQPGVLPVINEKAIELAIKTAIALGCKINKSSVFARKNYFYPDLPKGFQISQFELPLAEHGHLTIEVNGKKKKIGITRIHLEEDAGKLVHKGSARLAGSDYSLADYNRAATPLMEIVSEPDIRSPEEAKAYMESLAHILEYIGVCDAKMEEGSLRCDANISIRPVGQEKFGTKTEVKNMNSFKAVMKALQSEEKRHEEVIEDGGKIIQESRFYSEETETTSGMRSKEDSHDYRYFPEPDLVPLEPSDEWIEEIKKTLGELPEERKQRLINAYQISSDTAALLVSDKIKADYIDGAFDILNDVSKIKIVINLLIGPISGLMNEKKISLYDLQKNISISTVSEMANKISAGELSHKMANDVLRKITETGETLENIIKNSGFTQISDEGEIVKFVQEAIKNNPAQVEQFKAGKDAVIMFLVGQVMKASKGKAKPDTVQKLLREELKK